MDSEVHAEQVKSGSAPGALIATQTPTSTKIIPSVPSATSMGGRPHPGALPIKDAIATFERSLITPDAPFDRRTCAVMSAGRSTH